MPEVIEARPEPDFWARMCKTRPERAVAEIVWNALDADADRVTVDIKLNPLDGIEAIVISDNGTGILPSSGGHDFAHLGGSWKVQARKTRVTGRMLHGKNGQGRFRAFSLGQNVAWRTVYEQDGKKYQYSIGGATNSPGRFTIGDLSVSKTKDTGTTVEIFNVDQSAARLTTSNAFDDLSRIFAPYLCQYSNIELAICNRKIDASNLVSRRASFPIGPIKMSDGSLASATLDVIEWKQIIGRALYLCDEDGFALTERPPEIRAPGFDFGAYLKSPIFKELDEGNLLDLALTESVTVLVAAAQTRLSEYFQRRDKEQTASLIDRWKQEDIYPYKSAPTSEAKKKAQKIFDVCAITIHEHANGFAQQTSALKALSFSLLKEAVETNPGAVANIMGSFLKLPKKKQDLLSDLLERTTLSAIIDAVHMVDIRLSVAKGLRALVCNQDTKNSVKEREHIHRIVEDNPWLFGEEFSLGQSETSLTNLLREHLSILKRDERVLQPVLKASGQAGRIDLLLAKRVKRSSRDDDEHLIVELKRANKKLGLKELNQLKEYANVVMRNPKFDKDRVSWSFWLVGTEFDDDLTEEVNSGDREPGCAHIFKNGRGQIWAMTWAQIVHDNLSRLEFVREKLDLAITEQQAIEMLERIYPTFVPKIDE